VPEQATSQITAIEASVEVLVVVLAVAAGISTLAAGCAAVWWFVKPRVQAWAVTQIVDPVRNVERQVTVNGGRSNPPTLLDKVGTVQARLADVQAAQVEAAEKAAELAAEQAALNEKVEKVEGTVKAVDHKLDDHVIKAAADEADMWRSLAWIAQGKPAEMLFRPPPEPDPDE
jgi:hypothetical protein